MGSHHVTDQAVRSLAKSWWVVTALLLLIGSAVHFELVTEDDLGPLISTGEVAAGTGDLVALPGELDGYPSVDYAGLRIALVDARAIPINQTGRPIIVVDVGVENLSDRQARIPLAMLQLVRPDGRTFTADRFEYTRYTNRLTIDSGSIEQALMVFKLPPGQTGPVSAYQLEIGETGRWPVRLGLDGSPTEADFPLDLALAGDATDLAPVSYQGLRVELLGAVTALEHGVYRAPIGRHLAVFTVRVVGSIGGLDRTLWALSDGEEQTRAIRADVVDTGSGRTDAVVEVVFSYGTDVSQLELLVGRSDRRETVAVFDVQAFE